MTLMTTEDTTASQNGPTADRLINRLAREAAKRQQGTIRRPDPSISSDYLGVEDYILDRAGKHRGESTLRQRVFGRKH